MDELIRALQQASGDVVVVATVETFEPYADIREYAVKMFENRGRGIGEKGKDNGLLWCWPSRTPASGSRSATTWSSSSPTGSPVRSAAHDMVPAVPARASTARACWPARRGSSTDRRRAAA